MLFKKKTLDEKMEKYVKHHDWYAIQEVITGSKEEKIAAAKALGASDDQTSVDLLLRFIDDTDDDVVFAACESLRKVGSEHDTADLLAAYAERFRKTEKTIREELSKTVQELHHRP
ncbi:MAG: HEAT repeat domain-containing protein [Lachnospira eligens]